MALFPSSSTLTISSKPAAVQNKPEGAVQPGLTEQGDQFRFHLGTTLLSRAHTWCLGSASCSSSRTIFYQGAKAVGTWLGHSDHVKDERLDLDGIWSSAQRLGSPAPSPFALPLWPFELPGRHSAGCTQPLSKENEVASQWCHCNGMAMEIAKPHGSNSWCVQL